MRHLFFSFLKIAQPPDCTGLRFQGNGFHSQLSNDVEEGGVGDQGCEELLSPSIRSVLTLFKLVKVYIKSVMKR